MSWPASRNYDDCNNFEPQSVNSHCDNCDGQSCGVYQQTDYSKVVHPPTGTFAAGGLLEVETIVTAHHKGYIELRICSRPDDLTQDCFDEHLLVRDDDSASTDPAPVDANHPGRWYIPPPDFDWSPDSISIADSNSCSRTPPPFVRYRWSVRLPADLECEHCVVQFFWVTANSCNPAGLAEYFESSATQSWIASKFGGEASAWWKPLLASCPTDVVDPRTNNNGAEKFWNCADIEVQSCFGPGCTTVALSSTVTTTSSSTLVPTTATLTLSADATTTGAPTSTSATTTIPVTTAAITTSGTQCADAPLPLAWSGGGVHTCQTYEQLGPAYCDHAALQVACCFCQGGVQPATSTKSAPCEDSALPVAWSGGGVHTCATYTDHGGSNYCAHNEIKAACCFCGGGAGVITFSSLSSPADAQPPMLSRASVFATRYLTVVASFFLAAEFLA